MLTDLHLHKYLEGLLTDKESKEVEAMLEKNPVMRAKLQLLKDQSQILGKPTWQRVLLDRSTRKGSRTRYTTLLPALLMLMVILMVTQHWFARPGENSTFTMSGGNGKSLELLYNSSLGWRYLDKDFKPSDSLSIAVRDTGNFHVAVFAIYGRGTEAEVHSLFSADSDKTFSKSTAKPVFVLKEAASVAPNQIMVVYGSAPLPALASHDVMDILTTQGNERGGLDFQYQVFSAGH